MQVNVSDNIKAVLAGMQAHQREVLDKAIPLALNRTAEQARTQAGRTLRAEGYNFSAAEAVGAISLTKAGRGRMSVTLSIRRRAKLLLHFNARQTKEGVRIKVKGAAKLLKGAFIGQLRNGEQAVFIEDSTAGQMVLRHSKAHGPGSKGGWQAKPVRKLYGPSVGGAYAHETVQATMRSFIATRFEERLRHEVKRLTK